MRLEIGVQLLTPHARMPTRAYPDDAGYDLYVSQGATIGPGEFVDIPAGVAVELPTTVWGLIIGRSSTLRKRGLLVTQGVIDPGYRGPLYAGAWNLSAKPVLVRRGERVAQLLLMCNQTPGYELTPVAELRGHPRGQAGFGSSGL